MEEWRGEKSPSEEKFNPVTGSFINLFTRCRWITFSSLSSLGRSVGRSVGGWRCYRLHYCLSLALDLLLVARQPTPTLWRVSEWRYIPHNKLLFQAATPPSAPSQPSTPPANLICQRGARFHGFLLLFTGTPGSDSPGKEEEESGRILFQRRSAATTINTANPRMS